MPPKTSKVEDDGGNVSSPQDSSVPKKESLRWGVEQEAILRKAMLECIIANKINVRKAEGLEGFQENRGTRIYSRITVILNEWARTSGITLDSRKKSSAESQTGSPSKPQRKRVKKE